MQAGYLYEWVSVKHKSITRDGDFGSEIITWVDLYANIRANTTPKSGIESVRDGMRVMSRHIEITIRWRAGITTDMRVYHRDGRIFEIIDAVEIPRRRGLVMTCQEYSV